VIAIFMTISFFQFASNPATTFNHLTLLPVCPMPPKTSGNFGGLLFKGLELVQYCQQFERFILESLTLTLL
jgi:hypothetical protein